MDLSVYSPRTRRLIEEAQGASLEADQQLNDLLDDADEAAAAAADEEGLSDDGQDQGEEEEEVDMSVYSPRTRSLIEGAQKAAGEASQQRSELLEEATEAASSSAAVSGRRATMVLLALLSMLCASALYLFAKVRSSSNTGTSTAQVVEEETEEEEAEPTDAPPVTVDMDMDINNNSELDNFLVEQQKTGLGRSAAAVDQDVLTTADGYSAAHDVVVDKAQFKPGWAREQRVGAAVVLDGDPATVTGFDDNTKEVELTYDDSGVVERISPADAQRLEPRAAGTDEQDDANANAAADAAGLKQELATLKQTRVTKEGAEAVADDRRIAEIESELAELDMGGDIGVEDVEDDMAQYRDIVASGSGKAAPPPSAAARREMARSKTVFAGDIVASGSVRKEAPMPMVDEEEDEAETEADDGVNPEKVKVGDRVALQVCGVGGGRGRRSCKAVKSVCAAQWKSMVQESAQHAGQAAQHFSKAGGAGSRAMGAFMGGTAAKIYGLASGAPIPMPDYKGKGQVDAMTEKLSKVARNRGLSESQRQNAAMALMACGSLWHHQARMVAESMAIQYHEFLHTKLEPGKKWSDNPEFYYKEFTTSYYKDPLAADETGRGQREAYAKTYPKGKGVLRPGAEHDALGMMAMKQPPAGDPAAAALLGTVEELDMESLEGSCTAKVVTDSGATMAWPCFDLKRVSSASGKQGKERERG